MGRMSFRRIQWSKFGTKGVTIMMAPAQGFYTTPGAGKDLVRLAYVLCREDIQRALMILEKAIEEYNSQKP